MDIGSYMVHLAELPIDQKITREKEKALFNESLII